MLIVGASGEGREMRANDPIIAAASRTRRFAHLSVSAPVSLSPPVLRHTPPPPPATGWHLPACASASNEPAGHANGAGNELRRLRVEFCGAPRTRRLASAAQRSSAPGKMAHYVPVAGTSRSLSRIEFPRGGLGRSESSSFYLTPRDRVYRPTLKGTRVPN